MSDAKEITPTSVIEDERMIGDSYFIQPSLKEVVDRFCVDHETQKAKLIRELLLEKMVREGYVTETKVTEG